MNELPSDRERQRLRTEDEYTSAVARFDELWAQPASVASSLAMQHLIILIEEFGARHRGNPVYNRGDSETEVPRR
jgi:hypothetical protein